MASRKGDRIMASKNHAAMQPVQMHEQVAFEPIEPRLLLDGNVMAEVVNGDLRIEGDYLNNEIVIYQVEQGQPEFTNEVGYDFIIESKDGTTLINGQLTYFLEGVTGDLRARMGKGNDVVDIKRSHLPGDVKIDGYKGDDALWINDSTIDGNLRFSNRDGFATVKIDEVDVGEDVYIRNKGEGSEYALKSTTIEGYLKIRNCDGGSKIDLIKLHVGDKTYINNKDGSDKLSITFSKFADDVNINTGKDSSWMFINLVDFEDDLKVRTGDGDSFLEMALSGVGGHMRVGNDDGFDTQIIGLSNIDGELKIDNKSGGSKVGINVLDAYKLSVKSSSGEDAVFLDNVKIADDVYVCTGSGEDSVNIETLGLSFGLKSKIGGNLKVNLNSGEDLLKIGQDRTRGRTLEVAGRIKLDGGGNFDTLLNSVDNLFDIIPAIKNFEDFGKNGELPLAPAAALTEETAPVNEEALEKAEADDYENWRAAVLV